MDKLVFFIYCIWSSEDRQIEIRNWHVKATVIGQVRVDEIL